jgi:signal transduction histidine kinase
LSFDLEGALEGQPLLYRIRPGSRQILVAGLVALVLLAVFAVAVPLAKQPLPKFNAFIPVIDTFLLLGDWITATLLLAQASVLRSRSLIALGTGYLFTGFVIIPHALTFPGAFAATGLLGAESNTTIWLYFFWHTGLPISVILYCFLGKARNGRGATWTRVSHIIWLCVLGAAGVAILLATLALNADGFLPRMMSDALAWDPSPVRAAATVLMILIAVAAAMIWQGERSALDLWLLLVLWAWFIELALVITTSFRYSAGWYVGRSMGLLSGIFVLLMLLAQMNRLYAQAVVAAEKQKRQRESRMMTMDAVAASIAHELKQPLSAIALNVQAIRYRIEQLDPQANFMAEMSEIVDALAQDSRRAGDILDSVRAMFGLRSSKKNDVDINQLIRETTRFVSGELSAHRVTFDLQLAADLPSVHGNRLQLQEVLLNLVINAIEAMISVTDRPRRIVVRSNLSGDGVTISVIDNGIGISAHDKERIFEPFFSTKAEGTGLGLAISRSVAEAHGGSLNVVPEPEFGTKFELHLPRTSKALAAH